MVHVPLKELLSGDGKSDQFVSYPVCRPSGRAKGELNFSYKIGDVAKYDEPVTGYPAGLPAAYAATYSGGSYAPPPGYPPQPGSHQPAGYPAAYAATDSGGSYAPPPGYPPQPGSHQPAGYPSAYAATDSGGTYGYPPQQVYGYLPPVQKPKKNKMGLGLGAWLLGRWVTENMIPDDGEGFIGNMIPDDGELDF